MIQTAPAEDVVEDVVEDMVEDLVEDMGDRDEEATPVLLTDPAPGDAVEAARDDKPEEVSQTIRHFLPVFSPPSFSPLKLSHTRLRRRRRLLLSKTTLRRVPHRQC